ncbi:hypothetical protein GCM10007423_29110 [Dyadobacter endophyticus]|uniref:Peptidase M4 n=1 Tax=Dyadobacter endophyticus TaxID=1749036 RepID=A0ABQ1YS20_9BACT|nr:hypothetical protein [Dyadobacter endophyticus]GGH36673.1 hypothetical protein GCM10007423_29110 [Dyadobacter endophyticus]
MASDAKPPFRKLRGYAFDPALTLQLDMAPISTIVYKIPWEDAAAATINNQGIRPGPIGEYLEVIDYDPTVGKSYKPVDLNDPYILAQDGLDPSEGNPQFHQQMVYAVAMTTIKNFERALGRKILWADTWDRGTKKNVSRLRIYPHALREANAYYSPYKRALLFGYFSSSPADESIQMPASLIFTCLSHDIIAHETTHAILDGMHPNFNQPTNPDVLSFHEAFADIVALFQHFTFPEVLKNQIRKTRGDLAAQNLLGQLAQQFGSAIGNYGSLRDAIGEIDEKTKQWKPKEPNPDDYRTVMEPHARGSILVAAVFEAFINIYKSRVADLIRIASNGTGILTAGELPEDLVNRLADEAAKSADHVLQMCIRALDYCTPVDINFGDYLRAIITADVDLVNDDSRNYRLAFIDAFRRRGIYPKNIKTLSVESLQFKRNPSFGPKVQGMFLMISQFLKKFRNDIMDTKSRDEIYRITQQYIVGNEEQQGLHDQIVQQFDNQTEFENVTGLVLNRDWQKFGINESRSNKDYPAVLVHNLRLVSRVGPQGGQIHHIVVSLLQQAKVIVKNGEFIGVATNTKEKKRASTFMGGCTLIFDLNTLKLRYAISRPLLDTTKTKPEDRTLDKKRIEQQVRYEQDEIMMCVSDYSHYFGSGLTNGAQEPFAFLHRH